MFFCITKYSFSIDVRHTEFSIKQRTNEKIINKQKKLVGVFFFSLYFVLVFIHIFLIMSSSFIGSKIAIVTKSQCRYVGTIIGKLNIYFEKKNRKKTKFVFPLLLRHRFSSIIYTSWKCQIFWYRKSWRKFFK